MGALSNNWGCTPGEKTLWGGIFPHLGVKNFSGGSQFLLGPPLGGNSRGKPPVVWRTPSGGFDIYVGVENPFLLPGEKTPPRGGTKEAPRRVCRRRRKRMFGETHTFLGGTRFLRPPQKGVVVEKKGRGSPPPKYEGGLCAEPLF